MAAFIFLTGVFNFVLGFFLASALGDPPFLGLHRNEAWLNFGRRIWLLLHGPIDGGAESDDQAGPTELPPDEANSLPAIATFQELPEVWQQALQEDGLQTDTLAAGVVNFMRLEGAIYLEQLLTAEARARQALAVQNPLAMEQLAADLRFINVDWSRKERQAAELMEDRVGRLGMAEAAAEQLARFLRDHEAKIAEIDRHIYSLNFRADGTIACRRMLGELQQLIQLAHGLRDTTQVSLAAIYRSEAILDKLDRTWHYDAATGLLGRLGLESLFAGNFLEVARPAAGLRISIDRFGKVNHRLGARAGDQVFKAIASFVAELAAAQCEKSLVVRLTGSELLLLANAAAAEELTALGELIRQSFEAAGFSYQGTDLSLSLTMSVAAISAEDGLDDILSRLDVVKKVALRAGRNRTARWENGTAILALPPALPVQARMIAVEAAAA